MHHQYILGGRNPFRFVPDFIWLWSLVDYGCLSATWRCFSSFFIWGALAPLSQQQRHHGAQKPGRKPTSLKQAYNVDRNFRRPRCQWTMPIVQSVRGKSRLPEAASCMVPHGLGIPRFTRLDHWEMRWFRRMSKAVALTPQLSSKRLGKTWRPWIKRCVRWVFGPGRLWRAFMLTRFAEGRHQNNRRLCPALRWSVEEGGARWSPSGDAVKLYLGSAVLNGEVIGQPLYSPESKAGGSQVTVQGGRCHCSKSDENQSDIRVFTLVGVAILCGSFLSESLWKSWDPIHGLLLRLVLHSSHFTRLPSACN